MTASVLTQGLKVTGISLAFFLDSGFYYSVDTSKAETSVFGKNKGCNFAIGLDNSSP